MSDLLLCVWRELARRPGRALIHAGGYALALAFMVVVGSLLLIAHRETAHVLNSVGTHMIFFQPAGKTAEATTSAAAAAEAEAAAEPQAPQAPQPQLQPSSQSQIQPPSLPPAQPPTPIDPDNEAFFTDPMVVTQLMPLDLISSLEGISGVRKASPVLLYRMRNPTDGTLFSIAGCRPGDTVVLNAGLGAQNDMVAGAFLHPGDRGLAVLDEPFAISFGLKVGSRIVLSGMSFPVIGIIRPGIRPLQTDIYLTWEDARQVIERRMTGSLAGLTNTILLELNNAQTLEQTIATIGNRYPDHLVNTFNCYAGARDVMGMSEAVAAALLLIVFLGMTLFSASTQWGAVLERRREIGILRALGWSRKTVMGQIFLETLVSAGIGGITGIVLGIGVMYSSPLGILAGRPLPPIMEILLQVGGTGLALALVSGLLAAVAPAFHAIRRSPAQSLRDL